MINVLAFTRQMRESSSHVHDILLYCVRISSETRMANVDKEILLIYKQWIFSLTNKNKRKFYIFSPVQTMKLNQLALGSISVEANGIRKVRII